MWPDGEPSSSKRVFFSTETKCCTYVPTLPNYLVGRILDEKDPPFAPGRASIEHRVDGRIGVTPLGLAVAPVEALLYRTAGAAAFGRNRRLRCPHYLDDGTCGIWRHRNGVCSTWFCKHTRGATSQRFWQALDDLLGTVEREVARWCLVRLNIDSRILALLLPPRADRSRRDSETLDGAAIDGRVDDTTYRSLWGAWQGRERDLYRKTARLVAELGWTDVRGIGGATAEALARIVVSSYRSLQQDAIPERLVVGLLEVVATGRDHVRVVAYSGNDPLDLPRLLVDVLAYFDGRPTAMVLRQIRAEKRVDLQVDLIRRLVDFGVLVGSPAALSDVKILDSDSRSSRPSPGG